MIATLRYLLKQFPELFGGVVAYMLLLLYAATVSYMIYNVKVYGDKPAQEADGKIIPYVFPDGVIYVVTTVGGLVSALVIAKLAVTKAGENPTLTQGTDSALPETLSNALATAYLFVWMVTGLGALITGTMLYENVNRTLSDIGTTWLGLAVAAGYAYFGLSPQSSRDNKNADANNDAAKNTASGI